MTLACPESDGYRMQRPNNVPNDIYEMALMCWSHDQESRPSFEELRLMLTKMMKSAYEDVNIKKSK